jgi:hypothetical protein
MFHGYRISLKFGEATGKMLETWCWMKYELKAMSCSRVGPQYMAAWNEANTRALLPLKITLDELLANVIKRRRDSKTNLHLGQL